MAHFVVALLGKPSDVWGRPSMPGHTVSLPPSDLAASCGLETLVSNDLLSVRVQAPVTQYSLRLSTTVGRPEEATPSLRRRAAQARIFLGSPPPALRPRRDTASPQCLPFFEHRPRGYPPGLE